MKIALVLIFYIHFVFCEPPVPNSQYLPANGYSTISEDSFNAPAAPSSSYGPPSTSYGPPRNNGRPSNSYGPPRPSITTAIVRPKPVYGLPNNDDQSEPANYQFEYAVNDQNSGNDFGHMESRQGDQTQGHYYVLLPDGRKQIVNYEADSNGYRPKITYEEASSGGYQNGGYRY